MQATEMTGNVKLDHLVIDGKTYLELDQIAEQTGYEFYYLRRLAASGSLDSVQIGGTFLATIESVREYVAAKPQRKPQRKPNDN